MSKLTWLVVAGSVALMGAARVQVPNFDIKKACSIHVPDMIGTPQSCERDERAARDELKRVWATFPASVRRTCLAYVNIGGMPSYVELLTCGQMYQWSQQGSGGQATPAPAR